MREIRTRDLAKKATTRSITKEFKESSFESTTLGNIKRDVLLSGPLDSTPPNTFTFHPESKFRVFWDLLVAVLVFYQSLAIPYFLSFRITLNRVLATLEIATVALFLLDIAVTMNTGFYVNGQLNLRRKEIAWHYAKGWLCFDLLSSFPFNWCVSGVQSGTDDSSDEASTVHILPRLLSFAMMLRLARLVRLKRLLMKLEDYLASSALASFFVFVRLSAVLVILAHWMACFWYYIGDWSGDSSPSSWTSAQRAERPTSTAEFYVTALYWSFTTMTTVGYGDVSPATTAERLYVTVTMILSCGFFAYTLGDIGSLVAKLNAESDAYREKVVNLNIYMIEKKLPRDLQYRVRRFLEFTWEKQKDAAINEEEVLSLVSEPLKDEIYSQVNGAMLRLCPVFSQFPQKLLGEFSKSMKEEHFAPGDGIFDEGQMGYKVYFIKEGKVDVYHAATGSSFYVLRRKRYFGEISFFTNQPRCASAACLEFAQVLTLDRAQFNVMLSKYPASYAYIFALSDKARKGDLAAISVRCYLCKTLGHIARLCRLAQLSGNVEDIKEQWLSSRASHTRFICPQALRRPANFIRKEKKRVKVRHELRNVTRAQWDSEGKESDRLLALVQNYQQDKVKSPSTSDSSHLVELRSPEPKAQMQSIDSIMLESEEDSDAGESEQTSSRVGSFRKSLLLTVPPFTLPVLPRLLDPPTDLITSPLRDKITEESSLSADA